MKCAFEQSNDVQAVDAFPLAYGSLSEACVPFGIWGSLLKKWVPFAIRKPAERCALLGVWDLSDLSESAPCSAYGSLLKACILFGVGRKCRNGARLHGFGNVLPGNAMMGPFLGRIFFGSLFGKLRDLAFC